MRIWFVHVMLIGLATLPSSAYGQNTGNSYPPAPRYYAPYPNYPQAPNQQLVNQNAAPTTAMLAYMAQGSAVVQAQAVVPAPPFPNSAVPPLTLPEPQYAPSEPPVAPASKPPMVPRAATSVRPAVEQPAANSSMTISSQEAPKGSVTEVPSPFAAQPAANAMPDGFFCEKKECHVAVFFDYLYWSVHGGDVPYAQAFDGIDPTLSVPRGAVGVVSPTFNSGFRIGAAVSVGEGQWIVATFTDFFTERTSSIKAGNGDVLHNFLVFPNTASAAVDSLAAKADYSVQLRTADLDYKCAIICNDRVLLNWTAGVRYASLSQDLTNNFAVTGNSTVSSNINFDGFGPRFGLEGKYGFNNCGIFGYANGLVDLLVGQFRGNYEETNNFTGMVGSTSITSNRIVPILEFELGVGWESPNGHVRMSAGYYVGSWFNTMTMTGLSSSIGNVNFTTNSNNFRDNLTFDGFVGRVEFRY